MTKCNFKFLVLETVWELTSSDNTLLEGLFNPAEVQFALSELANDKAPGPDGFNVHFIKHFWPNISKQVFKCYQKFWDSGSLLKGFNSSFITLIPKTSSSTRVQDYRPISLINSISKLLTKVLANRMMVLAHKLFDDHQYGFIRGRQAAESILLVHEVHHTIKSDHNKGLILKLDFEKAFDTVRWDFLFQSMDKLGFGARWIMWIKNLLHSSRLLVLLNGSPTAEFLKKNGVRQGDPLSPLLFNIAGGVLSSMIKKVRDLGFIKGIQMGNDLKESLISNMQMTQSYFLVQIMLQSKV